MANYSTYTSPVDRMGAIAQVGGQLQNQRIQREEAPLRQGMMRQQMATQAHADTLNRTSEAERLQIVDRQLMETDAAATAYEALSVGDDTSMLGILQRKMPDFLAAAQNEGATPDQIRQRLNGLAQRGAALGVIKIPQQTQQRTQTTKDAQGFVRNVQTGERVFPDVQAPPEKGPLVTIEGDQQAEIGTISPDHELFIDPTTGQRRARVIPGTATDRRLQKEAKAAESRKKVGLRQAEIVEEDLGRAIEMVTEDPFWTTGFIGGQMLSKLGGTQANDLKALLTTIGGNLSLDRMKVMREGSATGSTGLGQVTEKEHEMMTNAMGAVLQSQSPEALKRNLNRLKIIYNDLIHGFQPGEEQPTSPTGRTATRPETGERLQEMTDGTWVPVQ